MVIIMADIAPALRLAMEPPLCKGYIENLWATPQGTFVAGSDTVLTVAMDQHEQSRAALSP